MSPTRTSGPPPHGGDLARARARWGGAPADWIDFSNSQNPWGAPEAEIARILAASAARAREYPDPLYTTLRAALARSVGVDPSCVWPLNGSVAGLWACAAAAGDGPVVVPAPSFREASAAARALGRTCEEPVLWHPGTGTWEDAVPQGGAMIVAAPNSPTGEMLPIETLRELARIARARDSLLCVDEAFLPFAPGARSMIPEATAGDGVVVLRSITKTHALPGLRLGFAVAAPGTLAGIAAATPAWAVGAPAEAVAERLSSWDELVARQLEDLARETARFGSMLAACPGLAVHPSAANFFLCETAPDGPAAAALKERMAERRLLIRDASDYSGLGPRHIRLAVRRPDENARLLAALTEVLA